MRKKQKDVYSTKFVIVVFVRFLFTMFSWYYGIRRILPKEVKRLKSPYLVLGNHVGFFDPFVVGNLLPKLTHFVASDASFKTPAFGFFLRGLGTIPTKKNIRDTKAIRDIISVIKQGDNVGIFPEAVRTWSGTSFPIDPSIAKLIKHLKVPVIVPILKGMNLFNPRWSVKTRRTLVEVEYTLLVSAEEIASLSADAIYEKLCMVLRHDEVDYQRDKMNRIRSKHKAEYISHVLYVCPECHSVDSFSCEGNDFKCRSCGYDIHIDSYSFFSRPNGGNLHFDNIRDWYNWEEKWMHKRVTEQLQEDTGHLFFTDSKSLVYQLPENGNAKLIGEADISLYGDKIIVHFYDETEDLVWNFEDLQTINPQVYERLEVFYDNKAFRIIGGTKG
ncbi:MAG: 1-acyl-sn-glycerol-3-phosphate acyltransferase, partial [Bacteroidetes bacterium]|nr:1-acyl-sn-glycerol-3-phosphate acyltransferase [Bacteroidota bacterium]